MNRPDSTPENAPCQGPFKGVSQESYKSYRGPLKWLARRHSQVLENAYAAAQEIRALEMKYGAGQPVIDPEAVGQTVYDYVRSLCDRQLLIVRNNLTQFKINSFLLARPIPPAASPNSQLPEIQDTDKLDVVADSLAESVLANGSGNPAAKNPADSIIAKLTFIESVIGPYRDPYVALNSPVTAQQSTASFTQPLNVSKKIPNTPERHKPGSHQSNKRSDNRPDKRTNPSVPTRPIFDPSASGIASETTDPALQQVEIAATDLARPGLLGSFSMNKQKTAQYEQQVVQELRQWRQQSRQALRWIAILLVVPILVAVLAKQLLFGPVLGNYSDTNPTKVQLNEEIRAEFAANLAEFKSELEIRELLKLSPPLDVEATREKLSEKASELWQEARNEELNGLKNVLADSTATLAFIGLVFFTRRRLTVIRSFSNRAFLSLSDPVKIFLFILVTDMFVGFHSAEGWDAILSGLTHHFGLPERPNAIKLFIATVPVMMDSFIKFWIFNYLTRFSPTSSAIFERMNS